MGLITSWITNIILIILLAAILELLLPNNSMHRYVKLAVGLMLLVVMLQPVLSVFQHDTEDLVGQMEEWGRSMETEERNLDDLQKSEIESVSLAYISEQVAVQLEQEAAQILKEDFGMEIKKLDVTFRSLHEPADKDHLEGIFVQVSEENASEETDDKNDKGITVERIEIRQETSTESETAEKEGGTGMRLRLSQIWDVPEELITLHVEGGSEE